jgi:hypothetical protein
VAGTIDAVLGAAVAASGVAHHLDGEFRASTA